jgi:ketosteroid isomerase-like protein
MITPEGGSFMGAAENKKRVLDFIEALQKGFSDAFEDALADDATWWIAGTPGSLPLSGIHRGKKGIYDLAALAATFFDPRTLTLSVQNTIAEGDYVAVEWITRCKTSKGEDYENSYSLVFEVRNGKIQSIREYLDTLLAKRTIFR